MSGKEERFWETHSLDELDSAQWEALCDGCARCCLHKLQHPDDGEVVYTDVACRLLDLDTCRCKSYHDRSYHVPHCTDLRTMPRTMYRWLPVTCAYRLRHEGKPLFDWHPLVSGDVASVVQEGLDIGAWAQPETEVDPDSMEDHIIDDPEIFE